MSNSKSLVDVLFNRNDIGPCNRITTWGNIQFNSMTGGPDIDADDETFKAYLTALSFVSQPRVTLAPDLTIVSSGSTPFTPPLAGTKAMIVGAIGVIVVGDGGGTVVNGSLSFSYTQENAPPANFFLENAQLTTVQQTTGEGAFLWMFSQPRTDGSRYPAPALISNAFQPGAAPTLWTNRPIIASFAGIMTNASIQIWYLLASDLNPVFISDVLTVTDELGESENLALAREELLGNPQPASGGGGRDRDRDVNRRDRDQRTSARRGSWADGLPNWARGGRR